FSSTTRDNSWLRAAFDNQLSQKLDGFIDRGKIRVENGRVATAVELIKRCAIASQETNHFANLVLRRYCGSAKKRAVHDSGTCDGLNDGDVGISLIGIS